MSSKEVVAAMIAAMVALAPTVSLGQPHAAPGVVYKLDPGVAADKRPDPLRFAKRVDAYLEADKQTPPAQCGVLFIGSASIAAWKTLTSDMAPAPVLGRGLGGSTVADQIFFFDKIVAPYKPRALFLYAGENDVVNGVTPVEVLTDLEHFMDLKTKALGSTPVYYIPIKASPARLAFAAKQQEANDLAAGLAKKRKDFHYIDISRDAWEGGKLLGTLKPIYIADGIHMTPEGYAMWTKTIKPLVDRETARANACAG